MNINLEELDFNNIHAWPKPVKVLAILFSCALIFFLGYWFDTRKQIDTIHILDRKQVKLKKEFEDKQKKAVNLHAYEQQMQQMKKTYGELLRHLPESTEVPALVEDISHQGLAAGLSFKSIKLLPERQIDFYAELGMDIIVVGTYHQLATFVSNVANLPRIVTLHNFSIKQSKDKNNSDNLTMNVRAKTYRYLGESGP